MFRKISLFLLLILAMTTVGACAPAPSIVNRLPAATSTPAPDPWEEAVSDAQLALAGADLDAHFQFYQETATQIDGYLAQLETVQPALNFIDALKQTELPVLGNVWDLLVRALDKAYLGAGVGLEQVDARLRDLLETHERLQRLDELGQTSTAVSQFQEAPSRETLQAMGEEMAEADFILAGVDKDAVGLQDKVDALLAAIEKAQSGLALVGGLAPQLQDAVKKIQQFIDDIVTPLRELSRTLDTLRKQIAEDRDIFWHIRDIIHQAENPPGAFLWPARA